MAEKLHEIRDPIHGFVLFDDLERDVINSVPFQRLKWIKQLAMSYEVYPGAVHTRFEHAIGTMELAGRVFDTLARKVEGALVDRLGWRNAEERTRQRRVVRLAALLHDVGHAPFSHAPEDLLPVGQQHEEFSARVIEETEIRQIIEDQHYQKGIRVKDVIPVALGPKHGSHKFSEGEALLTEIITGDLGVDRIDYLNRDAHHAGVAYGRFDYLRLLDTLTAVDASMHDAVLLAVGEGGLHAAEGLILARYFMFHQVYFHDVRVAYDMHLQDFLSGWLQGGRFAQDLAEYLAINDASVHAVVDQIQREPSHPLHEQACRLTNRRHFRTAAEVKGRHREKDPKAFEKLEAQIRQHFPSDRIRFRESSKSPYSSEPGQLLVAENGGLRDIIASSDIFPIKSIYVARVFAEQSIRSEVKALADGFLRELEQV